jgi:hypothetical protein
MRQELVAAPRTGASGPVEVTDANHCLSLDRRTSLNTVLAYTEIYGNIMPHDWRHLIERRGDGWVPKYSAAFEKWMVTATEERLRIVLQYFEKPFITQWRPYF